MYRRRGRHIEVFRLVLEGRVVEKSAGGVEILMHFCFVSVPIGVWVGVHVVSVF
jgi:hypothetical protein